MNNNPLLWDLGPILTENRCVKNNKSSNGRAKCRCAAITMWPRGSPCLSLHIHPPNLYGGSVRGEVGGWGGVQANMQMTVIPFLHCPRTFFFPPPHIRWYKARHVRISIMNKRGDLSPGGGWRGGGDGGGLTTQQSEGCRCIIHDQFSSYYGFQFFIFPNRI